MLKSPAAFILTLLCFVISACATKLDYQSPSTVNLSGDWVLNKELSQEIVFSASKRSTGDGKGKGAQSGGGKGKGGKGQGAKGRSGGRSQGGAARPGGSNQNSSRQGKPDAMTSVAMTIEQSFDSMGVRYQNQNYREVDWGKSERGGVTTTAGWKKETLIIKTNGKRMSFSESYHLDSTGNVLIVTFELADQEYYRVYDKSPAEFK